MNSAGDTKSYPSGKLPHNVLARLLAKYTQKDERLMAVAPPVSVMLFLLVLLKQALGMVHLQPDIDSHHSIHFASCGIAIGCVFRKKPIPSYRQRLTGLTI